MMKKIRAFAVIDVETTGLSLDDRVIELAVVRLDPASLEVIDEFDTLIHPARDVGATHIHGISASMVSAAPSFAELAEHVAALLDHTILVAHNLAFDAGRLALEFERAGVAFDMGAGLCTLRWTGQRLANACAALEISPQTWHRALDDARATAALFAALVRAGRSVAATPARSGASVPSSVPRTFPREQATGVSSPMPRGGRGTRARSPSV